MKQGIRDTQRETGDRKRPLSFVVRFLFLVSCLWSLASPVSAGTLSFIRDTIGTSAPSLPATHEVMFTVTNAIPPGGKIVVTPQSGEFIIPAGLNFLDVDLAVATSTTYDDRPLAGSPDATNDGFSAVSGSSGQLVFTLNGTTGINAGEKVQIEIGNNASFAATGTNFIINPTPTMSYTIGIRTDDASGNQIDAGVTMIAVVAQVTAGPVNTTITNPPVISNGLPTGLLPSGITAVELSVETDVPANCKYSITPNIPFASSTGAFVSTGGVLHSGTVITGLADGTTYDYYVRCQNYQLLANTVDYLISFSVGVVPSTTPPPPPPPPAPSFVGVAGGGDFLKTAGAVISGKAYPSAKVSILKDGKEITSVSASGDGSWSTTVTGLERGTYTFGIFAVDLKNRKSATISSTLSVIAGTTNTVTKMFLPPTLSAEKTSIDPGNTFPLMGSGIPKSTIEVSLLKQGSGSDESRVATTTADEKGLWSMDFDTKGLSQGGYGVKARSLLSDGGSSGFSFPLSLGIGQDAAPDLAARSDMNTDGKVNLIDFSILLFSWGTDAANADINSNGKVDLADFSILIFYWTG